MVLRPSAADLAIERQQSKDGAPRTEPEAQVPVVEPDNFAPFGPDQVLSGEQTDDSEDEATNVLDLTISEDLLEPGLDAGQRLLKEAFDRAVPVHDVEELPPPPVELDDTMEVLWDPDTKHVVVYTCALPVEGFLTTVVVKRVPHSTRHALADDALVEIETYRLLAGNQAQSPHFVRMLGAFHGRGFTFTVTEPCDGDLVDYLRKDLEVPGHHHDLIAKWARQLLEALIHLKGFNLGHRDISLENLLLKDGNLKLMDFGQATELRDLVTGEILYYQKRCGKDTSCAPECYLPPRGDSGHPLLVPVEIPANHVQGSIVHLVPFQKRLLSVRIPLDADARPGTIVEGEPCYAVESSDCFAVGAVLLMLWCENRCWGAPSTVDYDFYRVVRYGVRVLFPRGGAPSDGAVELMEGFLRLHPEERWTYERALQCSWLATGAAGAAGRCC